MTWHKGVTSESVTWQGRNATHIALKKHIFHSDKNKFNDVKSIFNFKK
ncbi:hypothetical protein KSU1_C1419 [Candidatus Jettenia caeni]|uniref:Uncharacterized protein n=1 Tax=Candidatus Jettenia caeni TaxID=247490 RepID=I3IMS0_9BACT|nr:hypothetical protein KSU1_C1419 [Candidatus Jettenia caeni]